MLTLLSDYQDERQEEDEAGEAIIGMLGNFSVSTGKAKDKKTFNVTAIVAAALVNGQVLEYQASFSESKRTILYFDREQSPYHCQLVMQRILKLAKLPIDKESQNLKFSHLRAIADPNERREIIRYAIYNTPNVGLVIIDGIFNTHRNPKAIQLMQQKVVDYEQALQRQTELLLEQKRIQQEQGELKKHLEK